MNLLNLLIRYSLRISAILFFPFVAKSQSCLNNNARCYIPNSGSNNVSVVDVASQSVISTIPVGNAPRCVAIIGRLHRAYITNVSGASVSVINITNNTVIATIPVGAGASGAVASPDGNTVYISNGSAGTVSVINTNTNAVTATISVGTSPFYEAISPDGTKLYVSNGVSNTVSVINTSTNSVIHTISGLTSPRNLVTNADGSLLYVTNSAAATVSVINTSTYAITTTLTVGTTPVGIALNKTNTRLAVANVNSNSVSIFSLPSHTLLTTISSGLSAPRGLSFTENDSNLFIVNTTSNLLSTYNMHTNSITSNVSIGSSATSIGNFIYEPLLSTAILPCGGTYVWNGNTYTTTGLKSFTTTGSYGCDSTSLLQLNADTSGYATHTITATGCDLYGFNNKIYTSSGTYYDTIHTSACDTAFTLNLTIHQSTKTRYAFVPNKNSDNVTVLDIVSNTVLQTIAVGNGPEAICFNPDGLKAYVANTTDNTISVINTITRVVEQTISCGGIEPVDLITNALGTELFVVNKQSGTVCVFDLKTYALLKTTPVGTNPSSIAMSKSEESYYVTCEPNLLKRIFINSQIIQSFTVGNAPKGVCVSNDDLTVYVANSGSNTVTKFNNGTFGLSLAATVTVGANPTRLVYLANDKVYVTCTGANQVYNAFAITPTAINVGVQPSSITCSYENNVLMVANSGSNTLTYIRPANDSVIGTSAVGNTPIANGTMLQPKSGTRINLCDAPGYTWANGTTYTSNGVYSHSFTNSAGCDSTSNLYLRLSNTDPIDVISTEAYVCGGGSTSLVVVNNKHCIPFGTNIIPPSVLIGGIIVNSASSQNKIDQVINVSENQYIVIDQKYIPVSASNLYNFHFFKGGGVGNADFEGACFFDFNDDGDFDDVNEYYSIPVVTLPGGGKLFNDINIQIPTTTFNGGIRCRFVVKIINNFYPSGLTQANSCTSGGPVQFMDFFLNVSGGQSASSLLNYTWQPANLIQSTNNNVITTSNLTSTAIYTVTATNSEGCSSSATITIAHQNTGLNVSSTSSHATVCEGAFVQFNSTAPGATSYQYTNGSVALSGQSVSFLTEGFPGINTFTVTASDGNICGTATASVNVYDAFTANATSTSPEICAGNPVQFNTQIQNIAPNTNLTYSWIPTTGLSNPTIANPIFTSTTPGYKEYKVTVSNGNICTMEKKIGITVKPSPTIDSIISSTSSICSSTNSISLNAVAHTPPVSYTSPASNNNSSPYYFGQTAFLNFNSFSSSATYPSGYTLTNSVYTVSANGNYTLTYSPASGLLYESIPIICTTSVPCNGNGFTQIFTNSYGGCEVRTLCGYSDKHYYEGCKVFIDFNIDGDFDDADEQVFSANYSIANFPISHVVNFTIPNTAKSGITRLRICNGSPYAYSIPKKDKIIDIPIEISGPTISYSWQPSLYLNATNVAQVTASNLPSSMEYYLTATYNGCQQQKSVKINDKTKVTASTLNGGSICSGSTTPVTIVADPPLSTLYCTPTCFTSGNTGNYISNFSLNGPQNINQNSTEASNDYSYFSSTIYNLQSPPVPISFSVATGGNYANSKAIWIDLNGDGDFTDDDEFVWSTNYSVGTATGSFIIPGTARNGVTRLRVLVSNAMSISPSYSCSCPASGEYEDYLVRIQGASNPLSFSWAPNTGVGYTAPDGLYIQLQGLPSTTIYTVTANDGNGCVVTDTAKVSVSTTPFITASSLTTDFCAGNTTTLNAVSSISTDYCTPTANGGASGDYIAQFNFNTISNSSGDATSDFTDYNNLTTQVNAGSSYPFSITTGSTPQKKRIYIDFNRDGDFTDANESVYSNTTTSLTVSGNITIPATAQNGLTKMRVVCLRQTHSGSIGPCGLPFAGSGEYEDYRINISNGVDAFVYQWEPSTLFSNNSGNNLMTLPLSKTTSFVVSADNNGCIGKDTLDVLVKNSPLLQVTSSPLTLCDGGLVTLDANASTTVTYCKPSYDLLNPVLNRYFISVSLNDGELQNNTVADPERYGDYTYLSPAHVTAAVPVPFTLQSNGSGHKSIWVDLNMDGDFDDVDENVFNGVGVAGNNALVNGSFTVPTSAYNGITRLRIGVTNSSFASYMSCATNDPLDNYEYEDYLLKISGGTDPFPITWLTHPLLNTTTGSVITTNPVTGSASFTASATNSLGCSTQSSVSIQSQPCTAAVQVKLFIEGYYSGNQTMQPVLLNQTVSGDTSICDSIRIELRDAAIWATAVGTDAVLNKDGTVNSNFSIPQLGNYYIVIKHRNAIETWSSNPLVIDDLLETIHYNFSVLASHAYGSNQRELEAGIWALYSGDINQDGVVDGLDYNEWENDNNNFAGGYFSTDINGDGIVDGLDFIYWEQNNNNFVGVVAP